MLSTCVTKPCSRTHLVGAAQIARKACIEAHASLLEMSSELDALRPTQIVQRCIEPTLNDRRAIVVRFAVTNEEEV